MKAEPAGRGGPSSGSTLHLHGIKRRCAHVRTNGRGECLYHQHGTCARRSPWAAAHSTCKTSPEVRVFAPQLRIVQVDDNVGTRRAMTDSVVEVDLNPNATAELRPGTAQASFTACLVVLRGTRASGKIGGAAPRRPSRRQHVRERESQSGRHRPP